MPANESPEENVTLDALIAAVRAGDGDAATPLFRSLRPIVRRFLVTRFGRGGIVQPWAEDVEQETLFRVHVHFHACRANSVGGFVAWVLVIARTAALDALRAELPVERDTYRSAIERFADESGAGDDDSPSLAVRVVQAQSLLPPRDAELLWLRVVANRSWVEVGSEMGISWTAARRRFQRAQRFLRSVLENGDRPGNAQ
ncbi:MAG: sigma-70 family RNA polymerase sigma factor [Gemmatimonadetes bacterium]|nr:sigma-70 family RNA polymerase sigma factor [Gemmatimonadota bacterium]